MARGFARILRDVSSRLGFEREWYLIALGAALGAITAIGAVGFALALHAVEEMAQHTQSHWNMLLLPLLPAAGALVTGLLVYFFARDASGHGVPQVIDAIARKQGKIPGRVGLVKIIASIATVGSGGSAGAEGPIVQIGATFGSVGGKLAQVGSEHRNTLVGCGAAAGIASVFNAPIAGVLFVLEVLLRDFSLKTFTPIVVAAVLSTAMTQVMLGENEAIFAVELPTYEFTLAELPAYVVLGLVCAVIGVGFSKLMHAGEDAFESLKAHPIVKPVIGALLLGVLGIIFVAMMQRAGGDEPVPLFFGNGYDTIRWLIEPVSYAGVAQTPSALAAEPATASQITGVLNSGDAIALPLTFGLLVLLLVFKAFGTMFTLASGGSGGVFAPSLFIGVAAGAAFGLVLDSIGLLPAGGSPATYALVGMGAVVAGTTFAPLTAILLIFELTREPYVLLPVMLACVIATVGSQVLMRDSIYTAKLRQAGVLLSWTTDLAALRRVPVASCQFGALPPEPIYPSDPMSKLITLHAHHLIPDFPVLDQETKRYIGMVTGHDIRTALIDREAIPLLLVAELMQTDLPTVSRDEMLETVLDKFTRHDVASLVVVSPIDSTLPMGTVSRASVMKRYREALEGR